MNTPGLDFDIYFGEGERLFAEKVRLARLDIAHGRVSDLCNIMLKAGSDKGLGWHNYTLLYDRLFEHRRLDVGRVLEIGIGSNHLDVPSNMGTDGVPGASLRGWREYFENAHIVGGDVDIRVLFQEEKISTAYVDQLKPRTISDFLKKISPPSFDTIIDDGLHEYKANANMLRAALKTLSGGGVYIIEDMMINKRNVRLFSALINGLGLDGVMTAMPHSTNRLDNVLIVLSAPA